MPLTPRSSQAIKAAQAALDLAIAATPTGPARNVLTECNMRLMALLSDGALVYDNLYDLAADSAGQSPDR